MYNTENKCPDMFSNYHIYLFVNSVSAQNIVLEG